MNTSSLYSVVGVIAGVCGVVLVFLVVTVVLVYNNCIPTRKVTQQAKGRHVYFLGGTLIESTQTGYKSKTTTIPGSYYVKDGVVQ